MGKEDPNAGKVAILNVFGLVYDMVAVFSIEYAGELAAALAASKLHPLQNETDAVRVGLLLVCILLCFL